MDPLRRLWVLLILGLLIAVSTGCGAGKKGPQSAASIEPQPPAPKDAAQLARDAVHAKIGATLRVDRLRDHPAGQRLVHLTHVDALFEGTHVDLLRDASLLFVAATGVTRDDMAVVVVQHTLTDDHVRASIEVMIHRSDPPGEWLEGTPAPAARVRLRGQERLLLLPCPGYLVVLPTQLADRVSDFAGPMKLTSWDGPEAAIATIDQPSTSLRAKHAPRIPSTISRAGLRVFLPKHGGMEIAANGLSTTPEQAIADAEALTRSVDTATSVKVAFVRVRFFRKILFHAQEQHVKADVSVSDKELAKLLSMVEMFANR